MIRWIGVAGVMAGSWLTAEFLGGWLAFGLWSAVMLALAAFGWWAISTSRVGEISWKNFFAVWVLPWGYQFGGGILTIVSISCLLWIAACGASAWMGGLGGQGQSEPGVSLVQRIAVLLGWVLNALICLYLLAVSVKRLEWNSGPSRRVLSMLVIPVGILVLSIALIIWKQTWWAAVVALGPASLLAMAYGLFLATLLTAGRNARWN